KFPQHAISATPIVANAIPVFTIPLCPTGRKFSHLVTSFSNVPGLRDQLHLGDHRILVNDIEERTQPVYFMKFPGQGSSEIESETINVHFKYPVTKTVHDQSKYTGKLGI